MPITLETAAVIRQVVTQTLFDMMAVQAISNVRLVREPTAVTVKFDTVHATFATVDLFRMVHGEIDLDMEKENLAATGVELFGSAQDHHAVFISGLEQEHRYWFRISVPRRSPAEPLATGHIRSRGEFASLRRDSFVDIEQLHIIDDSDTTSDGDLRFSYALYDASAAGNPRLIEPRFTGELDRASGEDIDSPFGAGVDSAGHPTGWASTSTARTTTPTPGRAPGRVCRSSACARPTTCPPRPARSAISASTAAMPSSCSPSSGSSAATASRSIFPAPRA